MYAIILVDMLGAGGGMEAARARMRRAKFKELSSISTVPGALYHIN